MAAHARHDAVVVVAAVVVVDEGETERVDVSVLILLNRSVKCHLLFCDHVFSVLLAFYCVHLVIVPYTLTLEYLES